MKGRGEGVLVPDVRVCGEDAVFEGFRRHPTHWKQAFATFSVVVRLVDVPGHPEVCREEILKV